MNPASRSSAALLACSLLCDSSCLLHCRRIACTSFSNVVTFAPLRVPFLEVLHHCRRHMRSRQSTNCNSMHFSPPRNAPWNIHPFSIHLACNQVSYVESALQACLCLQPQHWAHPEQCRKERQMEIRILTSCCCLRVALPSNPYHQLELSYARVPWNPFHQFEMNDERLVSKAGATCTSGLTELRRNVLTRIE